MFRVNLKETPVKAGTYPARVVSIREIKTKNGDPMVFVDWLLLEGPDANRIISQGVAFVPQMVGRNNHFLNVLEQPHGDEVEVDPTDWIDRLALVTVALEANGSQVVEIAPIPKGQTAPVTDDIPF